MDEVGISVPQEELNKSIMTYDKLTGLPPIKTEKEIFERIKLFRDHQRECDCWTESIPVEIFGLGRFKEGVVLLKDVLDEMKKNQQ